MAAPHVRTRSVAPVAAGLIFAVMAGSGCGGDERVQAYRVPKTAEGTRRDAAVAAATATEYRILGAMYPADNPVWFFKLVGPADLVTKYEADFDALAASVSPKTGGAVPAFTVPAGWKLGGPRRGDFVSTAETVRLPEGGLEVTVIAAAGDVTGNVARWAGQVGQAAGADVMKESTKTFDAAGGKGLRVDVRGPQNPAAGGGMGRMKGGR